MTLLTRGVLIGLIGFAAVLISLALGVSTGWTKVTNLSTPAWIAFIQITHGTIMFASSYVEEEHHFWYWMSSAWVSWLYLTR